MGSWDFFYKTGTGVKYVWDSRDLEGTCWKKRFKNWWLVATLKNEWQNGMHSSWSMSGSEQCQGADCSRDCQCTTHTPSNFTTVVHKADFQLSNDSLWWPEPLCPHTWQVGSVRELTTPRSSIQPMTEGNWGINATVPFPWGEDNSEAHVLQFPGVLQWVSSYLQGLLAWLWSLSWLSSLPYFIFPPSYQGFLESSSYKLLVLQSSSPDLLLEEDKLRKTSRSLLEGCPHMILKQGPSEVLCHGQDHFCWAMSDNASYRQNANPSLALLERVEMLWEATGGWVINGQRLRSSARPGKFNNAPYSIPLSGSLSWDFPEVRPSPSLDKISHLNRYISVTLHISTTIPCHTSPQPTFSLQAFLSSTSSLLKTYTPLLFYNTPRSPIKPAIHIFNY